jgi:hypothetical protein
MMAGTELREVEFGLEALTYIQSQLARGKSLSQHLLQLPLEAGRVVSYLPDGIDPKEAAQRFAAGGVVQQRKSLAKVADLIAGYLRNQTDRVAVFEDQVAKPGDPWLQTSPVQFFTHGSDVYHFIRASDNGPGRVRDLIRFARDYVFTGIVARLADHMGELVNTAEVSPDVIRSLAAGSEHIIVGAFDGEGALIWSVKAASA